MEYRVLSDRKLTLTTIGGILDLYFFVGSTPEHVVQLYHKLVGYPFFAPYWALGHQHWARNLATLSDLKSALKKLQDADIPNEAVHVDVAENFKAFTLKHDFAGIQEVRKLGTRVVLFMNPAISTGNNSDYLPYEDGLKDDVFIKKGYGLLVSEKEEVLVGKGLPAGTSVFPDFLKNSTQAWWKRHMMEFISNATDFDGLSLELNEPAELSALVKTSGASCENTEEEGCQPLLCPTSRWDDPPYVSLAVTKFSNGSRLHVDTLCMSSAQGERRMYRHYDVHNIYGWSHSYATRRALDELGRARKIILSSSTFPSSGRDTGHVINLADNSDWGELKRAIVGVIEFNMFGIPYVGVNACTEGMSDQLCSRWTELTAFFPLSLSSRLHKYNTEAPRLSSSAGYALSLRYQLLAYLYTCYCKISTEGGTLIRPLSFEFPLDRETYGISEQFMIGPAVLISPILEPNATTHKYYLPVDQWYEYSTSRHVEGSVESTSREVDENSTVLVHMRAGHVVPLQPTLARSHDRFKAVYHLHVYPKAEFARGELFIDDGFSRGTIENHIYDRYSFIFAQNVLRISVTHLSKGERHKASVKNVLFHNIPLSPTRVTYHNQVLHPQAIQYDKDKKTLQVSVDLPLHSSLDSQNTEVVIQVYGVPGRET
ncbi:maltase-glucoamylase-like [Ornithodoros turicata]|uniref:maltase-glucoamylase-like n=1 Tax=Ornithodoros turicata TaxID=34597 RepID=UPI00313946FF